MTKTSKARKHSGWITPRPTIRLPRKEIIDKCLEPKIMYSEWDNYRDGSRGYGNNTKIRNPNMTHAEVFKVKVWNKKNKRLIDIRKARKWAMKRLKKN